MTESIKSEWKHFKEYYDSIESNIFLFYYSLFVGFSMSLFLGFVPAFGFSITLIALTNPLQYEILFMPLLTMIAVLCIPQMMYFSDEMYADYNKWNKGRRKYEM